METLLSFFVSASSRCSCAPDDIFESPPPPAAPQRPAPQLAAHRTPCPPADNRSHGDALAPAAAPISLALSDLLRRHAQERLREVAPAVRQLLFGRLQLEQHLRALRDGYFMLASQEFYSFFAPLFAAVRQLLSRVPSSPL